MKILVIGSKGFLGKAVVQELQQQAFTVFEADIVNDYNNSTYFQVDVTNADFRSILRDHQFGWIVNCAGAASVPDSFTNPHRDFSLNVNLVSLMLNAIREENPDCKFLQFSSAAVYGNPIKLPIQETDATAPLSPYGFHKLQAEKLCEMYYQQFGIHSKVIRIFSAFGPGLEKQLLWDIFKKTRNEQSVALFGTGNESRDFIYSVDVAKAVAAILKQNDQGFTIYNLASGVQTTVQQAAQNLLSALDCLKVLTFNGKNRTGDPLNWQADISKITAETGFKPTYNFETAILELASWLQEKKSV